MNQEIDASIQLIAFALDNHKFALPLPSVERIVRIVEITRLPKAPEIVIGIVNMQGRIIPVVDIRKRFRLPEREITLNDNLVITQTSRRLVGIVVDMLCGVVECPEQEIIMADNILPSAEYVEGVAKLKDGLIIIHNIDKFLSFEEEKMLGDAIKKI